MIHYIQFVFGPVFKKIFHCSEAGSFCIVCGFLCGCPVGARLITLQLKENRISIDEAQYLLSFCNNLSPMFCISYGILYAIGSTKIIPYLLIIYGSAFIYGILTRPARTSPVTLWTKKQTSSTENLFLLIDVCIIDSFLILIKLCGYLILFSIINSMAELLLSGKSMYLLTAIAAFLEITNGLSIARELPLNVFRTMLCVFSLSFGGLCCIFQTSSVISDTTLSLKKYLFQKINISLLSLFFYFLSFVILGF